MAGTPKSTNPDTYVDDVDTLTAAVWNDLAATANVLYEVCFEAGNPHTVPSVWTFTANPKIEHSGTPDFLIGTTASSVVTSTLYIRGARTTSTTGDIAVIELLDHSQSDTEPLVRISARKETSETREGNLIVFVNDGADAYVESARVFSSGVWRFYEGIETDTINEETSAAGVTIDSVLLKDGSMILGTSESVLFDTNNCGMWHDGSNQYLRVYTGNLNVSVPDTKQVIVNRYGASPTEDLAFSVWSEYSDTRTKDARVLIYGEETGGYTNQLILHMDGPTAKIQAGYGTAKTLSFYSDTTLRMRILDTGPIELDWLSGDEGAEMRFLGDGGTYPTYWAFDRYQNDLRFHYSGATELRIKPTGVQLSTGSTVNEFSTDDTLVDDSDTAVPTEQAVKGYIDAKVLEGSAEKEYITLVPSMPGWDDTDAVPHFKGGPLITNVYAHATNPLIILFYFNGPLSRDGKSFYVDDAEIVLATADSTNYVHGFRLYGLDSSGATQLYNEANLDLKSAQVKSISFSPQNTGSYYGIAVRLYCYAQTAGNLRIAALRIGGYWA